MRKTLLVDPVLAEALALRSVGTGLAPEAWLSALIGLRRRAGDPAALSTMGADGVDLHEPVEGLPFDLPARLVVDHARRTVVAREIALAEGELTYCGVTDPGDAFFDGPLLVAHRRMALPDSLLVALAGSRVDAAIATGSPALDARTIASARVTDFGMANARMAWRGEETATLELRLVPVDPILMGVECGRRRAAA